MSIDAPNLPGIFDWKAIKLVLDQWFIRLRDSRAFVQPGSIILWPTATTVPSGWVNADGSTYDKAKFKELQAALQTQISATQFQVPNPSGAPAGTKWIIKV